MNFLIIFSIFISYIFSQAIPNVVLTGEPRVIARRILNVDMKTAQQLVHPDNQMHVKYQVNVVKNPENLATEPSGYITEERTPVTIYRRILRPARITFNGDRAVTDNVQGTSDAVEMESWTLNKSLNNNMNNMNKRWIFGSTRSFSLIYLILIKFSETFRFLCTL